MRCVYTSSNTFFSDTNNVALWSSLGLMALGITTAVYVSRQQRAGVTTSSADTRSKQAHHSATTAEDPVAKEDDTTIRTFTEGYVKRLISNVVSVVGRRLWRKTNWMDIVSRANDATTVVFSRDTWLSDLCKTVSTSTHHIIGVSVRCPLTLRVTESESDVSHSVLLNAFAEYDIRLDATHRTATTPDPIVTHRYQTTTAPLIESILTSEYSSNVLNSVTCKMTCEMCNAPDLAELAGLPLTDVAVAQLAGRLLIPKRWSFDSNNELCQFVYAQCANRTSHLPSSMTPDRVLKMFSHEDSDEEDEDATSSTTTFFDGPLVAILCHWVDDDTKESASAVEEDIRVQVRKFSGKCVFHKASCGILVAPKQAMPLNTELHALAHTNNTTLQSFIAQVQNRASVASTPRLTHVTMVEVI